MSVVREWRAEAGRDGARVYADFFAATVLPHLQRLSGFEGALVLATRPEGAGPEVITVQTRWRDLEAVRAFAGHDIHAAVVEPEVADLVAGYDRRVRHHQILVSTERTA